MLVLWIIVLLIIVMGIWVVQYTLHHQLKIQNSLIVLPQREVPYPIVTLSIVFSRIMRQDREALVVLVVL